MAMDSYVNQKLPKDVWDLHILTRLSFKDLFRFGATCRSWRSLAAECQRRGVHQLPWMLIAQNRDTRIATFLSLSDSKIHKLRLPDITDNAYFFGSSHSYLLLSYKEVTYLFNPFSRNIITIPQPYVPEVDRPSEHYRYYLMKAIANPISSSQFTVAAVCSSLHVIQMCDSQGCAWSVATIDKEPGKIEVFGLNMLYGEGEVLLRDEMIERPKIYFPNEHENMLNESRLLFTDVLFYKGVLHALTARNEIVIFRMQASKDLLHEILNILPMERPKGTDMDIINNYLVESCGKLLMVYRFRKLVFGQGREVKQQTVSFLVYKLHKEGDLLRWVPVKSLGDQLLFLGRNPSMSISVNGIAGLKGNSIYFTEDYWPYYWVVNKHSHPCLDNGVFHLEVGHIEPIDMPSDTPSVNIQPIWVTPHKL